MSARPTITLENRSTGLYGLVARFVSLRRRRVAALLALALLLAGLAVVPPVLVARIVDAAVENRASFQIVFVAGTGIAILALCDALLTLARRRLTAATELAVRDEAATAHFRKATRLPLPAYSGGNEAALIRSFDDLDSIVEFVASHSVDLLAQLLIIAGYITLMLVVDWQMAAVYLALAGLGLAHSIWLARAVQRSADRWLPLRDSRFSHIVECITSMLTIKTLSAHAQLPIPFRTEQDAEQKALQDFRHRRIAADAASRFWAIATPGIGTAVGVALLVDGQLSAGSLVLFLSVSAGLVGALSSVHQLLQELHHARASLERMHDLTDLEPEPLNDAEGLSVTPIHGAGVKHLNFTHAGGARQTIANLSMSVARGEHIAIVGPSGEGKTTLAHLFARLIGPESGAIDIGDPSPLPLDDHRRAVLLVSQAPTVFGASLRENVRMWNENVSDEAVHDALARADLGSLTHASANSLDTMLGAKGNPLSAGQRQRLGIARVFLRRPEILILDEATSAMDTETESRVLGHLREFMHGRTMLVITHREAVAATFDRVLRMRDREIQADP